MALGARGGNAGISRKAGLALALMALVGCVVPIDPIRLATRGPQTDAQLEQASRPLRPTDRLAVMLRNPGADAPQLLGCVIAGLQTRLPPDGPAAVALDDEATARLSALLDAAKPDGTLGPEAAVYSSEGSLPGIGGRSGNVG